MKKGARQLESYRREKLEAERGFVHPGQAPLRICLVFPNTYHVGMSNLAVHMLYSILNDRTDCVCERSFCEEPLTGHSLESGSRLDTFHIVAFTVSFELDYPNAMKILRRANIPTRSAERDETHPLVVAGGPCIFSNPEPLADCFDVCVIGEGEEVIHELVGTYARARARNMKRASLLSAVAEIDGSYVPSLFEPIYSDDGRPIGYESARPAALPITARVVTDLDDHPCHSAVVTPGTEFANMFLVELGRGCRRGCRFCSACHIYLKRERSLESIERQILKGKSLSNRIGLVTSDLADYRPKNDLIAFLLNKGLGFSVSSVRADAITEDLLEGLKKTGQRTLTLAPEVASRTLARYTGKKITADTLLRTIDMALGHGIISFRLYFMIGFPGERDEDIEAIVGLAGQTQAVMRRAAGNLGKIGRLTVSVNPFVPKPFTPLESCAFAPVKTLSRRIRLLREGLGHIGNTKLVVESPRMARLQCAFSRGDRRAMRLAELLADGQPPARTTRLCADEIERYTGEQPADGVTHPWNVIKPPATCGRMIRGDSSN